MKIVGFWTAETKTEERLLNGLLCYTIWTVIFGLWIEITECYMSFNDFYVSAGIRNICSKMSDGLIVHTITLNEI